MGSQNGTSYASPFIAGLLACLAEVYPTLTQAQARAYLQNNAVTGLMADTADAIDVDVSTRVSTDGANIDRIALWKNHRATSGNMAFNTYNKDVNTRPTSGLMYPRTRTRRRG
jgi:subtilisin family serine protease